MGFQDSLAKLFQVFLLFFFFYTEVLSALKEVAELCRKYPSLSAYLMMQLFPAAPGLWSPQTALGGDCSVLQGVQVAFSLLHFPYQLGAHLLSVLRTVPG